MKSFVLLFTFIFSITTAGFMQSGNVVFFAEQGEKFSVIMNGLRVNDKPETHIKVSDLRSEFYKVKIIFDNPNIPDIDKNIAIVLGEEVTYNIRKNKKGEYILAYFSQTPLAQLPPPPPNQTTIVYTQIPPNDGVVTRGGTSTTTTTTTTVVETPNTVGTNINVGGLGVNVTITDNMMGGSTTTTYSQTTTTTTIITEGNMTGNMGGTVVTTQGCVYPMGTSDFNAAKTSISSKSFEDSKVTVAKQVIDANCLSTRQVKEIMQLMTFEENKLTIAKYAYNKTTDPNNYFQLNDAFTFESSIDELNAYINANRR